MRHAMQVGSSPDRRTWVRYVSIQHVDKLTVGNILHWEYGVGALIRLYEVVCLGIVHMFYGIAAVAALYMEIWHLGVFASGRRMPFHGVYRIDSETLCDSMRFARIHVTMMSIFPFAPIVPSVESTARGAGGKHQRPFIDGVCQSESS